MNREGAIFLYCVAMFALAGAIYFAEWAFERWKRRR